MKAIYLILACGLIQVSCQKQSASDEEGEQATLEQQDIPYGSNNGKYVSINNTQVYYEEYGTGTPLLMLHGGTLSINNYRKIIPGLSERFRVIAVDTPGHGRSEQAQYMSYQYMADYFSQFIDALKLDSVYVIGWSDGGMASFLLAADRPDKVKRIIPVGSQFGRSGYTEAGLRAVKELSAEKIEKEWRSEEENQYYQSIAYKTNDFKDIIEDCKKMWGEEIYVPAEKAKKIQARCLVVLGDRDFFVTAAHGVEMYNTIKGSELLVLPNTNHDAWKHVSFNEIAIKFLTQE